MLTVLRIRNLAVVEELELELAPGLNAITGETGAGKSIVLRSLGLVTGGRASGDLVRAGSRQVEIEALFSVEGLQDSFQDLGDIATQWWEKDPDFLLLRRVIDAKGSSKMYANGVLVTAGILQKTANHLLEFTGQHEQQSLLTCENHLTFLDRYGDYNSLLVEVSRSYREYAAAKKNLDNFLETVRSGSEVMRRYQFELDELSKANLAEGELAELEAKEKRLANQEKLTIICNEALALLDSDESGIERELVRLQQLATDVVRFDGSFADCVELIGNARVSIEESRNLFEKTGSKEGVDSQQLESLRERVSFLKSLQRKYRLEVGGLIAYLKTLQDKVADFANAAEKETQLREKVEMALFGLRSQEVKLTKKRQEAGQLLAELVEGGLHSLEMKQARFAVEISPGVSSARGADKVEFMLAANPGSGFMPLTRVASGGELSRVLLVLKAVLAAESSSRLQVFDEVDAGISGAVSQVVGEKLLALAKQAQVLVVTHSPQIAAMAELHFQLAKTSTENQTRVEIRRLDPAERIAELARMLAGRKVSTHFEDSARELLAHREQFVQALLG